MAVTMRAGSRPFTQTSITLYLDHLEAGARSPKTIASYREVLTRFLQTAHNRPISVDIIREFLSAYHSPNTRSVYLTILRQWFKFLRKRGLLPHDPSAEIPRPKTHRRNYPALSEEEFIRLREALPSSELRVLATILFYVGPRISEALTIRRDDITFEPGGDYGTIDFRRRKGGAAGYAAFGPEVAQMLRPYLDGAVERLFAVTDQKVRDYLKWRGSKVGIAGVVTPHRLRHAFITRCINESWSQHALQQQVGHSNPMSTARYYHPTRSALIDIMKRTHGIGARTAVPNANQVQTAIHLLEQIAAQL